MERARIMLKSDPKWTCEKVSLRTLRRITSSHQHMAGEHVERMFCDVEEKKRNDALSFALSYPIIRTMRGKGIVFGHSDGAGGLRSLLVFTECDPKVEFGNNKGRSKEVMEKLQQICLFLKMKLMTEGKRTKGGARVAPQSSESSSQPSSTSPKLALGITQDMVQRLETLEKDLKRHRETYGPKAKYWYVADVSVNPDYRDRGYDEEVMRQLGEMADSTGHTCYVECASEKTKAFYETFGYRVVGNEEVLQSTEDDGRSALPLYCMVREPRVATPTKQDPSERTSSPK